jgi:Membrane protein involved in the export of O-antigen and teichoic acid
MQTNRTKNATRNIFWGMANNLISIILPFILRTIMIYVIGVQYVGLGSLFSSILSILNLAELGFGSALVFSMYKPIAEGDKKTICAILNFYKKCYQIIGCIVLIIGLVSMPFLEYFIKGDYPPNINLYILYAIYLFNTVISYFIFAYKKSLLTAHQRNDINSNINSVLLILQYIIQIVLLLVFKNFYLYIIVLPIMTIANNLISASIINRLFPEYVCKGKLDYDLYKSIIKKVSGIIFAKIGGTILNSVDNIVISAFLGLNILAIYSNYYYIIISLFGILAVISNAIKPVIGNCIATESVERNYKNFNKLNFMYIWIVSWWSICLLCLYQPFMVLWVGEDLMLSMIEVVLFVVFFFIQKWCDMLWIYQEGAGIWWEGKFVPLIAAIINLIINIVLVQKIGLSGVLISTIISVALVYLPGYAYILFKYYFTIEKGLYNFILRQMIYLLTTIVIGIITYMICGVIPIFGVLGLLLRGIICMLVPNLLLTTFYFNMEEFREALAMAKAIIKTFILNILKLI